MNFNIVTSRGIPQYFLTHYPTIRRSFFPFCLGGARRVLRSPEKKKERKRTPDSRLSGHKRSCRVEPSSNALPVTIITNWIGKYEASLKSLHLHYMLSLRSTLKKLQVLVYLLLSVTEYNHMNSSLSPYNDWGIKSESHRKYELIVN